MANANSLRFLLLLSLFLLNSFQSESAVASIDLGSEWMKVAVVNLKPGQPPISIAINEMSKRKSPCLISFHADSRLIGEESSNLLARYPHKVYSHLTSLLAKPYDFTLDLFRKLYLSYETARDDVRDTAVFKAESGNFTAEEMVGMILRYAVGLAETQARSIVKDVVITVPPFTGVAERRGLSRAADLAGLNVLALVNEHSGAALQYGIDKDFSNGSRHVVFYDMGASSTYAALVYFSAYNAKELGKTVPVNQFQVKDVKWDAELGGQSMELRLVEYFADEFNKQLGNGDDIRNSPKAMAKLKKQVKRTKEILSANMMAPISVESLYDDRDFRSSITREKFEELCEDLWEKALVPLKEVLKHSGLNTDDLYAVELIGGSTRVPKLQAKLQEFLGRKELDKHLDADEAIVLGASLHAANLSDGIKLNRKLGMIDGSSYGFLFELNGDGLLKDENTRQLIVPRMKKLPSKMFRSIVHDKDFEVSLSYEGEGPVPPGISSLVFAQYDVSGLADATEKYSSRNLSSPIKANLHFSLSRSGIFSLDRAEAVVEITEWVEVPKKNLTVDNSTSTSANTTDADAKNASEENSEKLDTSNGNSNTSDSSSGDLGTEKKLKKRTFRVPLKVVEKTIGPGMPLSKESFADAKRKIEALDNKDAERRRTAELKNNLEGYIYSTKDKLESEEFGKISTDQERQSFIEKLNEVTLLIKFGGRIRVDEVGLVRDGFEHIKLGFDWLSKSNWSEMDSSSSREEFVERSKRTCFCGLRAPMWTAWTDDNPGRRFIGCPNYKDSSSNCKFFSWVDPEISEGSKKSVLANRLRSEISMLKEERKRLVAESLVLKQKCNKIEKLKAKVEALKCDKHQLKVEMNKCMQRVRFLILLVFLLCVVIVGICIGM
ncbi:hypothetical protein CASFOL_040977 [Castilleja foliolosa]|uniref:GRF-type domain-containing protein n=1 Tax=Castilleja foliolosa TaxID=1961234 RepID=A0ABD3BE43_9LAMI